MSRDEFNPNLNKNDLPDALVKELRLENNADDKILDILKAGGGTLNVSDVLVGYYKLFNEVKQRTYITSALYRLRQKGLIAHTGKKGEYKLGRYQAPSLEAVM